MPNIYSVVQVNNYIKNMFAQDYMLGHVYIKGEISNLKYHSSGHIYFTLKDEKSAISAVMFAGNRKGLTFKLEEGQSVVVNGSIEVYDRAGTYQVYAKAIKLAGQGDLKAQFEALKNKLEEMGMFDKQYKQPIPKYIKTLGVVTAPTGAAIQDIINITTRRNPYVQIVLYPALVQGDGAPQSVIEGIHALEAYGVDVMIIGRGGGSMEDLWGFNDENLAQAIFDCQVPIISAVGHEIDYTISDYVSDMRAPTPSAAAELAVYEYDKFIEQIEGYKQRLDKAFTYKIDYKKGLFENYRIRLKNLSPESKLNDKKMRLINLEERLSHLMNVKVDSSKHRLEVLAEKLSGLSPAGKLAQGFSHVSDESGKTVYDYKKVKKGDKLNIHVENGIINATVNEAKAL